MPTGLRGFISEGTRRKQPHLAASSARTTEIEGCRHHGYELHN